jgi:hypothetical protein
LRVLKKGGKAGFTVWGRPENSPKFTLVENAKKLAFGTQAPLLPSFHLCDVDKTKALLKKAGFSKVFGYYTYEATSQLETDSTVDMLIHGNPFTQKWFMSLSEGKVVTIYTI